MAENQKPLWYQNKIKRNSEYDKNNVKQITLKLNMNTESDLIEFLDTKENKQGYIKELIRKDMAK